MVIGIIGGGFVGGAVARGFMEWGEVRVYDVLAEKATHCLADTLNADFVFVCLPTNMRRDGSCDLSVIENFFEQAAAIELNKQTGDTTTVYVIKSTVPVGTTQRLAEKHQGIPILHSPEFLTARCALVDFQTPARNIIGVPNRGKTDRLLMPHYGALRGFYSQRFPGVPVYVMSSYESELVKYVCNSFFAVKVAFFNEIYRVTEAMGLDFETVRAGVLSDGRIAHAHTQVPCGGELGYGGSCLPKDVCALMHTMRALGIEPLVTAGAWELNKQVRTKQDWKVVDDE